ncbi:MAG: DinB family protein [Planctomycetes bacterium]|nr:DinB family protein [Planctomycetota bacterium]MCB9830817.1 DinB family protein [Planctomycetota bacterium]MCB9900888.1 DinB family protein [Planctomycetota bacterium]
MRRPEAAPLIAGLRLVASRSRMEDVMGWTEILEREIAYTYGATDSLMKLVDDDKLDWKPPVPNDGAGTGWMTTGQLLRHITDACGACCKAFATNDWSIMGAPPAEGEEPAPMPSSASVQEARDALAKDKDLALATVRAAGDARMDDEKVTAPWGIEGKLGEQFLDMVKHLGQHKGQLFYYLKMQGKPVHTGHLWGMEG